MRPQNIMATNWKENFKEGKELILTTASEDGDPNANIVISLGFVDDKLLIADCQMKTTIDNLSKNPKACVISGYFKIKGSVEIFSAGKYFDLCVEKNKEYKVKNAILVEIKNVFDLNKVLMINDPRF